MAWLDKKDNHKCPKPLAEIMSGEVAEDSRWQCDQCEKVWLVAHSVRSDVWFFTAEIIAR